MKAFINLPGTNTIWLLFFSIMLSLPGCTQSSRKVEAENKSVEKTEIPENRKLSPAQAHEMITADSGIVILDVRTPKEFEGGHIAGAVNIDFLADDFEDHLQKLDKEKKYLVYCMVGKRSEKASELMKNSGFKQVNELMGGYREWSAADLPDRQD